MTTTFKSLPVGTEFLYEGQRYRKLAISMAEDERGWGCVFCAQVDHIVEPIKNSPKGQD